MWDKAPPLLAGVDIGTSGVRTQAFALSGEYVAEWRASFVTRYPAPGRAEQDPAD